MWRQGTWITAAAIALAAGAAAPVAAAADGRERRELPDLRTRYSATFATPHGTRVTEVSSTPRHFRDAGRWKRIDVRLVRRGDGFANAANELRATLPSRLDDGDVRLQRGADWLAFRLLGASGRPGTLGEDLTYRRVMPGVDARYTALPEGLKEDIVLRSRLAPRTFRFALRLPADERPRLAADGSVIVDGSTLRIAAPVAIDANGSAATHASVVAYRLRPLGDDVYELTLSVDDEWLDNRERAFPVSVDPTITINRGPVCTIRKPPFDTAVNCGATQEVGHDRRLLMRFDASSLAIPASASIVEAKLMTNFPGNLGPRPELSVHELTRSFDTQATWQRATASQAWTSPGGDVRSPAEDALTPPAGGAVDFGVTDAVERWIRGESANRGFLVRQTTEQSGTPNQRLDLTTFAPRLVIEWQPALGILPRYGFETYPLPNGAALGVNVGNGNVVVHSPDLEALRSNGPAFRPGQSHFGDFSSLITSRLVNTLPRGLTFGYWGYDHTGVMDVEIRRIAGGDRVVSLPGQASLRMVRQADGSFLSPPDRPATLAIGPDGSHELTLRDTGHTFTFPPLQGVRQAAYVASVRGPAGDRLTVERPGGGNVAGFADGYGGHTAIVVPENDRYEFRTPEGTIVYRHEGIDDLGHRVTHFDDPAVGTTTYRYNYGDIPHILQSIDTPGSGVDYAFSYDTAGRVTEIRQTQPGSATRTTTYEYQSDRTIARYSDGTPTTFFFDPVSLKLHRSVTGASPPAITVGGLLPSYDGHEVGPQTVVPVSVSATDPSGIAEILVLVDGELAAQGPQSTLNWDYEAGYWGGGPHVIEVQARDGADETTTVRYVITTTPTPTDPPDGDEAELTEQERLDQALEFRAGTGLNTDPAHVQAVNANPQYQDTIPRWTVALTPAERDKVEFANESAGDIEDVDQYGGTQPDYAELYIDSDGLVHVGFTGDLPRHLADLQARYDHPDRLRLFQAQYNRDQINAVVHAVNRDAAALAAEGIEISTVGFDVARNDVEVETPSPTAAKEQLLRSRYGSMIRLVQGNPAAPSATLPGRAVFTRPLMGGLRVSGRISETVIRQCTLGWPGIRERLVTRRIRGRLVVIPVYDTWFIVAAHCSLEPNGTDALVGTRWTQGERRFGYIEFAHFVQNDASEFGMIRLPSRFVSPWVYSHRRGDEVVTRKIRAYEPRESDNRGEVVCYSGATSGTHCGVVNRNEPIELTRDDGSLIKRIEAQRRFRAPCRGGDSGAPVFLKRDDDGREVTIAGHVTARTRPVRQCFFSNSGHTYNYVREHYVDNFQAIVANP